MMLWPAQMRADAIYRAMSGTKRKDREPETFSTEQIKESLELLRDNDHASLLRKRAHTIKTGSLTWARLAEATASGVTRKLLNCSSDDQLRDASDEAHELNLRLQERTAVKGARVTMEVRSVITAVAALGQALKQMLDVKGGMEPSMDDGGRAIALRRRWIQLGGGANSYVVGLVQAAAGRVLSKGYHPAVKGLYSKAVAAWANGGLSDPSSGPLSQQRSSGGGSSTGHGGDEGERVTWDSDDDLYKVHASPHHVLIFVAPLSRELHADTLHSRLHRCLVAALIQHIKPPAKKKFLASCVFRFRHNMRVIAVACKLLNCLNNGF
jgi:hypothetical protein